VVDVLVVEDDVAVARALEHGLRRDGYGVAIVGDGRTALGAVLASPPDVVLLDVLLPGMDGLAVCRQLRARGNTVPILMLTARDLVGDRVAGLDAGADDYLVKPFALEELRARVRALLRRVDQRTLSFADIEIDLAGARVSRDGRSINVTRTEYALLEMFLRNPGRVLSRRQIGEEIWGYDVGAGSNTLWVHISYLRGKLESEGSRRIIQTVRGLGYVLRESP
jgi:two-component system response regulator MprA